MIILLRHAKAVQSTGSLADFDRPLRPKGLLQCEALIQAIPEILSHIGGVTPQIWCSPSLRTQQTLNHGLLDTRLGSAISTLNLIQFPQWLYLADAERLEREIPDYSNPVPLMIIAHNNGLSDWAYELTGGLAEPLGTCHLIILRRDHSEGQGKFHITFRWEPPKFMD
jgi:phosphohistidine phosphatase SixA